MVHLINQHWFGQWLDVGWAITHYLINDCIVFLRLKQILMSVTRYICFSRKLDIYLLYCSQQIVVFDYLMCDWCQEICNHNVDPYRTASIYLMAACIQHSNLKAVCYFLSYVYSKARHISCSIISIKWLSYGTSLPFIWHLQIWKKFNVRSFCYRQYLLVHVTVAPPWNHCTVSVSVKNYSHWRCYLRNGEFWFQLIMNSNVTRKWISLSTGIVMSLPI